MAVLSSKDSPPLPSDSDSGSAHYFDKPSGAPSQSDHNDNYNNQKLQHPPPSSSSSHVNEPEVPELPWIPSSAVTSPDHYGGLNPENLATLSVLNTVTVQDPQLRLSRLHYLDSFSQKPRSGIPSLDQPMQDSHDIHPNLRYDLELAQPGPGISRLLALPSELIDAIFSFLSPYDLTSMSAVCHQLRKNALTDIHWQAIIQSHTPGSRIRRSYPCSSFMELYAAHDGVWFLPKFKIWFCDLDMPGNIVICRYDQRRGCIEGVRLVAIARDIVYSRWAENENVVIHTFNPLVSLHLESPVIQLNAGEAPAPTFVADDDDDDDDNDDDNNNDFEGEKTTSRFSKQVVMSLPDDFTYSRFAFTRPMNEERAQTMLLGDYPYHYIWPPPTIPAHHHVSGSGTGEVLESPSRRDEVSDQTFRIWRGIRTHNTYRSHFFPMNARFTGPRQSAVLMGERSMTYSTLDPVLYTPTPTKPWRGIWVGDYTAHGCEFLLVHQPDDPPATDGELNLVRSATETEDEWQRRRLEARIYRGRLEGIKLTGDANVPRGEYSFIAHNLGPDGLAGVAESAPFTGARMVHSSGHVAGTGFQDDKFIESKLFLISENRLAHYWIEYGFITYFERVNIDDFTDPEARS